MFEPLCLGLASLQQISLHSILNGPQGTDALSGENESGPTALAGEVWSLEGPHVTRLTKRKGGVSACARVIYTVKRKIRVTALLGR